MKKKIVILFIIIVFLHTNSFILQSKNLLEMPLNDAFALLLEKQPFDISSMEDHKRILKAEPNTLESLYFLANTYSLIGRYDESIIMYEKLKTIPHARVYFCYNDVGWNYDLKGEYDKAISEYKKALQIHEFDQTYYNLGYLYARLNTNLDEAYSMIDKASKLNPSKSVFHLDALALASIQKGDFKKASEHAKNCIDKLPKDYKGEWYPSFYFDTNISVWYHNGLAQFGLKNYDDAAAAFDKISEIINSDDNPNTRRRYAEFFIKWRLPKQPSAKYNVQKIEKDKWHEIKR